MKKTFHSKISHILSAFIFVLLTPTAFAKDSPHFIPLLKEMFTKVTLEKNDKAISLYYSADFELYSNGKVMEFKDYLRSLQAIYQTPIQFKIRYDEKTMIEQGNKVAARLFITTKKPHEVEREIEVILIAEYKKEKIYRLWELTFPDWSKMKAFENVLKNKN